MTWFEASATLKEGDRVCFVLPWDIYPETTLREGELATVIENSLNEMQPVLIVLPDSATQRERLKEWDGHVWLYGPDPAWDDANSNWQTECHVQRVTQ
jgi:hypothetical protein